ncbi:mitochondrial protein Pet127-domain-containing protein [Earliella scabrosa]|nr:mitochondrial protein Pet127-domain-containing protein [Earliella scabrosa]
MRSLARWSSLAPRLQQLSPIPRIQRAPLSSDEKHQPKRAEFDPTSAQRLIHALQSLKPPTSGVDAADENGSAKDTSDSESHAQSRSPSTSSVVGKRKRFKTMEVKSMKPAAAVASLGRNISHNEDVVASGVIPDRAFKPLQDARKWRKSRVPRLEHGLETVLSRQGVHWLKDPETDEYNFDRYLEDIPQVADFAFDRLGDFVPSSKDHKLIALAQKLKCKFAGSTSSLTGILTQIYLLLSEEKHLNISGLSAEFDEAPRFFTPGQRIPSSVILQYQNGVYTTDYDGERDSSSEEIILLPLGRLLERFLTMQPEVFRTFLKSHHGNNHPRIEDVHRYAKHGHFLMRSQLDCVHESLPGTGVFDLKTRAISQIRHDVHNYLAYIDVALDALIGRRDSFEEEYYDMIRSAFLEYSFQARIGNMDGIMVAYHNTARIFGFQYVSLREMDLCLFGHEGAGERVFERCVHIMELMYKQIADCYPAQSVKCTFEKRGQVLRVWVEPLEHDDPSTDPPVTELTLAMKNLLHGRVMRGPYAVTSAKTPWSIMYQITRNSKDQAAIRERREVAYKRQISLAKSLPEADPTVQAST